MSLLFDLLKLILPLILRLDRVNRSECDLLLSRIDKLYHLNNEVESVRQLSDIRALVMRFNSLRWSDDDIRNLIEVLHPNLLCADCDMYNDFVNLFCTIESISTKKYFKKLLIECIHLRLNKFK